MKKFVFITTLLASISMQAQNPDFYILKTYLLNSEEQVDRVLTYLEEAYVPAVHSLGLETVGVFELLGNDTATVKKVFVLIPSKDPAKLYGIEDELASHDMHLKAGKDYWEAKYDDPAFERIESSLLRAFSNHSSFVRPKLKGPMPERIYELRSYEGSSEKLYRKKVEMFNEAGEIAIFTSINANAVFYAETLVGPRTPNLVYMTTYENMEDRDAHWDAFRNNPAWKVLSGKKEYDHTVSKSDKFLLTPADFSDL